MCHKSICTTLVARGDIAQGLENIRKALLIFEELPALENADNVADTYAALGLAYSRATTRSHMSRSAQISKWRQARVAYQKSLDTWLELKGRAGLTIFNASEPDKICSELAKCDAALTGLANGREAPKK
jgi:hypothetical protein